ncbi:MAG: hypothetical protein AVDCRST_MAG27-1181, partial [uncultured Craurococcus sp.]
CPPPSAWPRRRMVRSPTPSRCRPSACPPSPRASSWLPGSWRARPPAARNGASPAACSFPASRGSRWSSPSPTATPPPGPRPSTRRSASTRSAASASASACSPWSRSLAGHPGWPHFSPSAARESTCIRPCSPQRPPCRWTPGRGSTKPVSVGYCPGRCPRALPRAALRAWAASH